MSRTLHTVTTPLSGILHGVCVVSGSFYTSRGKTRDPLAVLIVRVKPYLLKPDHRTNLPKQPHTQRTSPATAAKWLDISLSEKPHNTYRDAKWGERGRGAWGQREGGEKWGETGRGDWVDGVMTVQ